MFLPCVRPWWFRFPFRRNVIDFFSTGGRVWWSGCFGWFPQNASSLESSLSHQRNFCGCFLLAVDIWAFPRNIPFDCEFRRVFSLMATTENDSLASQLRDNVPYAIDFTSRKIDPEPRKTNEIFMQFEELDLDWIKRHNKTELPRCMCSGGCNISFDNSSTLLILSTGW